MQRFTVTVTFVTEAASYCYCVLLCVTSHCKVLRTLISEAVGENYFTILLECYSNVILFFGGSPGRNYILKVSNRRSRGCLAGIQLFSSLVNMDLSVPAVLFLLLLVYCRAVWIMNESSEGILVQNSGCSSSFVSRWTQGNHKWILSDCVERC